MTRICFLGGGAIGGILAGHLATVASLEVSLVGRRPMVEAIRRDGLRVLSTAGEIHSRPHAVERTEELGPQDYVFLTVKAQQMDSVLPSLPPLLGPETVVLPPTTGIPYWFFHGIEGEFRDRRLERIDPGGRHWAAIDPARVLGVARSLRGEMRHAPLMGARAERLFYAGQPLPPAEPEPVVEEAAEQPPVVDVIAEQPPEAAGQNMRS